jgi:rhodanese-related sulfurtransferase
MGQEKQTNWSLQAMTEEAFIKALLSDQPFVPAYFSYDVELNRKGAAPFKESVEAVVIGSPVENQSDADTLEQDLVVVDARKEKEYKKGHLPHSINLMEGAKFETWLGSIIKPGEQFYLAGESKDQLQRLVERAAAIGYEPQIKEAFVLEYAAQSQPVIDVEAFKENPGNYTIVDVRNGSEVKEGKPFKNSISIPLPEIRNRVNEIPTDKPIVVHCAGGYRSAAGSSIIQSALDGKVKVFDLSDGINQF